MAVGIDEYFYGLIKDDEVLKDFENDVGINLIANSVDYKIRKTQEAITGEIVETYNPKTEVSVFSYMMYKIGYARFKKPIVLETTLISDNDELLQSGTRFTDGYSLFVLESDTSIVKGIRSSITISQYDIYKKSITVDSGVRYFYVPLNVSYKSLSKAEVRINGELILYSQNFIDDRSEISYEIDADGMITVVILLGNEKSSNITIGTVLEVSTFISNDITEVPNNMSIIGNSYDIVCEDIKLKSKYEEPISIDDMKRIIRFGRKNLGDICLNEDYKQFILMNVAGIKVLKVWQEKEEELEVDASISNINKVFIAFIDENDVVANNVIASNITKSIEKYIYGKEVVVKPAILYDIEIKIVISTNEVQDSSVIQSINNKIAGYYDDSDDKISKSTVYKSVFSILVGVFNTFDLSVVISDKGIYKNRNIFRILDEKISISFKSLE